jgi:hypothetical protein
VGADVEPQPFRPVLRGVVLTGRGSAWIRRELEGRDTEGDVQRHALWWPPTKIAGRYLAPYLEARDEDAGVTSSERPAGQLVEFDLERDLPAAPRMRSDGARPARTMRRHCSARKTTPRGGERAAARAT